jgi:hypothetical protein
VTVTEAKTATSPTLTVPAGEPSRHYQPVLEAPALEAPASKFVWSSLASVDGSGRRLFSIPSSPSGGLAVMILGEAFCRV